MLSTAGKRRTTTPDGDGKSDDAASAKADPRKTEARTESCREDQPLCIMQSNWDDSDDRLTVSYYHRDMQCQLKAGPHQLLAGAWDWEITAGEKQLHSLHEDDGARWENTCWEQNQEVTYAEMQLDLAAGRQIQRQIFLARRERFAFLADVVAIPAVQDAQYRLTLKLGEQLRGTTAAQTREITLSHSRRPIARVLPVSLPEWRRQSGGELHSAGGLTLTQPVSGRFGHAALFIDLDPRRIKRQLTWRRLTVGESLQIIPSEVAVGYRIQIGKEQWLIYRSLGPRGNRTVLGQNFSTEFVVARFRPNGIAEKLLEIL